MNFIYEGQSANEMYQGDEHLCFGDCVGDKYIYCTCVEERENTLNRMAEEFQDWLITEGQAS